MTRQETILGNARIVLQSGVHVDSSPAWGPDGIHFAAVRDGRVVVATVSDGVQAAIGPKDVVAVQWGGPPGT